MRTECQMIHMLLYLTLHIYMFRPGFTDTDRCPVALFLSSHRYAGTLSAEDLWGGFDYAYGLLRFPVLYGRKDLFRRAARLDLQEEVPVS